MNYITRARENVAMYSLFENHVSLEHMLAVVIGSHAKEDICRKISSIGNDILDYSVNQLEGLGLTHNESLRLHASLLLTKQFLNPNTDEKYVIRSPEDAANYLMNEMRYLKQEHFISLLLDTKNQIISKRTNFIGSLNASIVHPREVFKEALKESAASIIIAHNHPSGSPLYRV